LVARQARLAKVKASRDRYKVVIDAIRFGSATGKASLDLDFEITGVPGVGDRPPEQLMPLPALVLGLILWLQRRRSPTLAPATATVAAAGD
jgi:MYXO-CTERM domain-containing protein